MDQSLAPGDDFFGYSNGEWMKATPIPADTSYYGIWAVRIDDVRKELLKLIEESVSNPATSKIAEYYTTFMDETAIEAKGIEPMQPQLAAIAGISDHRSLARVIGSRLRADVDALNTANFYTDNLLGVWITQGLADPSRTYPYFAVAGRYTGGGPCFNWVTVGGRFSPGLCCGACCPGFVWVAEVFGRNTGGAGG
jgi:predicted metalloendopeptidase